MLQLLGCPNKSPQQQPHLRLVEDLPEPESESSELETFPTGELELVPDSTVEIPGVGTSTEYRFSIEGWAYQIRYYEPYELLAETIVYVGLQTSQSQLLTLY